MKVIRRSHFGHFGYSTPCIHMGHPPSLSFADAVLIASATPESGIRSKWTPPSFQSTLVKVWAHLKIVVINNTLLFMFRSRRIVVEAFPTRDDATRERGESFGDRGRVLTARTDGDHTSEHTRGEGFPFRQIAFAGVAILRIVHAIEQLEEPMIAPEGTSRGQGCEIELQEELHGALTTAATRPGFAGLEHRDATELGARPAAIPFAGERSPGIATVQLSPGLERPDNLGDPII